MMSLNVKLASCKYSMFYDYKQYKWTDLTQHQYIICMQLLLLKCKQKNSGDYLQKQSPLQCMATSMILIWDIRRLSHLCIKMCRIGILIDYSQLYTL